ncbi:carbon storage regulator CsrA [Lacrimispora xylanisolvens]|uniref:Translational regulator CsrA n=1 Tax=Lacrimispora xylanisolvens TaxID=384636 RepID=A0A2S6HMH1_9FIRM|nr:carbon storage regulator [Hungatella xylanolytica]PPK78689.1 carbon storage regulator CsrA [Hungatella xylanolytica]
MLILQRKKEQSLNIGDNISITILEIGNDWVKLAIDAPRDISILRSELVEAASANQEAVSLPLNAGSISKIKDFFSEKKENSENT